MAELLEIRWHGRGGQGAKTVALLFAESALATGKYIQAFMEFQSNLEERWGRLVNKTRDIEDRLGINLLDVEEIDLDRYEIEVVLNELEEEENELPLSGTTETDDSEPSQNNSDGEGEA